MNGKKKMDSKDFSSAIAISKLGCDLLIISFFYNPVSKNLKITKYDTIKIKKYIQVESINRL